MALSVVNAVGLEHLHVGYALAQRLVHLGLFGGRARELVDTGVEPGALPALELLDAPLVELVAGRTLVEIHHHERRRNFAEALVLDATGSGVLHVRVREQALVDLEQ